MIMATPYECPTEDILWDENSEDEDVWTKPTPKTS